MMNDADHVFELDTRSIVGPSPRGSLHAAVSIDLGFSEVTAPEVAEAPEPAKPQGVERGPIELPPLQAPLKPRPLVTFVISTFNRRDVLLETVDHIGRCGLKEDEHEVIVVDNASTDGTSAALRERYPLIHLLQQGFNGGPVSKN